MRNDRTAKMDRLALRKEQIEAQLATLKATERERAKKLDTRRKIVVGAAVLAHANMHPAFREELRKLLGDLVTRPVDRAVLTGLLAEDST